MIRGDDHRPGSRNIAQTFYLRTKGQHQERRQKSSQRSVWQVIHGANVLHKVPAVEYHAGISLFEVRYATIEHGKYCGSKQ